MNDLPESVQLWIAAGYTLAVGREIPNVGNFIAGIFAPVDPPEPAIVVVQDGTVQGAIALVGILAPLPVVPLPVIP